jgi:hypothetical protein
MHNSKKPSADELPSSTSLLKSTLIAVVGAAVLLVTVVLPAEYGVDPTGVGRMLGLTEMGEIKMQLASEAERDRSTAAASQNQPEDEAPSEIPQASSTEVVETINAEAEPQTASIEWRDSITILLQPGEATEVKLTMQQGDVASYHWTVDQGDLNSDLHGENEQEAFISYRQGRFETANSGEFTAEFDGVHGWFWRNRSELPVTVTLDTRGEYSAFERLF